MHTEIYQKKLGIGELIGTGWQLFTANIKLILQLLLVLAVPTAIMTYYTPATPQYVPGEPMPYASISSGTIITIVVLGFLTAIVSIFVNLGLIYAVKEQVDGKILDFGSAIKKGMSRFWSAVGTNIMAGIFLIGLYILLIIPGIIYSVYWMFVMHVIVLENKGGMEALKHSKGVVKGRWWGVLGYAFVIGLFGGLISMVLSFVVGILPQGLLSMIVATLISMLVNLFMMVIMTVFYVNLNSVRMVTTAVPTQTAPPQGPAQTPPPAPPQTPAATQ